MVGCLSKNLMRLSSHRRRQKKNAALKSCQNLLRSFHNGSGDVNPFLMMQCPCVLQVTWCRHFLWQSETGAIGFVYHFAIQRSTGLCTETIWDLYIQIGTTHVLIKQLLVVWSTGHVAWGTCPVRSRRSGRPTTSWRQIFQKERFESVRSLAEHHSKSPRSLWIVRTRCHHGVYQPCKRDAKGGLSAGLIWETNTNFQFWTRWVTRIFNI